MSASPSRATAVRSRAWKSAPSWRSATCSRRRLLLELRRRCQRHLLAQLGVAPGLDGKKLPFTDNSKYQYNLVGWYQDDKWQARVAYNYRTDRLSSVTGSSGDNLPVYQDATGFVDVNVSYNVRDNIVVYFNGSNVTGEIENYYVKFADGKTQYANQNEFEPRYTLGIRAKW
jgi:outer membrane receptor protein involved in Fe transport